MKLIWETRLVLEQIQGSLRSSLGSLKAHLQPKGIASRGTIFIYKNPAKAEINPIRSLR